ncbi:MAG: hypothetical protein HY318_12430 [Armatimonadetes bacterium]|nr:hypothetical protein [Armatimonadota bacterium]
MASLLGTGFAAVLLTGCAGGGFEDPTGILGSSGQFESFEIAFAGSAYKRYVPGDTLLVSFSVTGGESVSIWVTRPDGASASIYSRGFGTTPQFTGVVGYPIPNLTGVYTVEGEVTGSGGNDSRSAQVEVVSGETLGTVEVTFIGAPGAVSYEVGLAPGSIDILTPKNPYKLMGLVPGVYILGVAAFTSMPPFGLISTGEVSVTVVAGETTPVTVDFTEGKSRRQKSDRGLSRWRFRSIQKRRSVNVPPVK